MAELRGVFKHVAKAAGTVGPTVSTIVVILLTLIVLGLIEPFLPSEEY